LHRAAGESYLALLKVQACAAARRHRSARVVLMKHTHKQVRTRNVDVGRIVALLVREGAHAPLVPVNRSPLLPQLLQHCGR